MLMRTLRVRQVGTASMTQEGEQGRGKVPPESSSFRCQLLPPPQTRADPAAPWIPGSPTARTFLCLSFPSSILPRGQD